MANSSSPLSIPIYPSLSMVNVVNFVSLKLCGDKDSNNYDPWKVQMLSLITSQGVTDFINPLFVVNDELRPTDMVVRGWILSTLSDPMLLKSVADLAKASEVWSNLELIYTKPCYPLTKSEAKKEYAKLLPGEHIILDGHDIALEGVKWLIKEGTKEPSPHIPPRVQMGILECYIGQGKGEIVKNFEHLGLKNHQGSTLLHMAAAIGNMLMAKSLVEKDKGSCFIHDNSGDFPIHYAALHQQKRMTQYLLPFNEGSPNPYAHAPGLKLLLYLIEAQFFDIAKYLVEQYPYLASYKDIDGNSALAHIIGRWNQIRMHKWQRLLSSCLPTASHTQDDVTDTIQQESLKIIWKYLAILGVPVRILREKKIAEKQALELIGSLSKRIRTSDKIEIFGDAIAKIAEFQVKGVFKVLVDSFPEYFSIYSLPSMQHLVPALIETHSIRLLASLHNKSNHKYLYSKSIDSNHNNVLHLAAKLAPTHRLNRITGAALQMQYELKWFKFVKTIVHPYATVERNDMGQTPDMVFTEQHNNLKNDGEKWMKETATSSTIAAALIATVMFAAAITVPGGNGSDGYPFFANKAIFIMFAVSDCISLFASIISLLMFLYILTSRYEVDDFLDILPVTLLIGLATLFFSIAFMMASFSITLYFVFGKQQAWVLGTSIVFGFLPIFAFARLNWGIFVDLVLFILFERSWKG